ncbi:15568_t:CDS:10, partial [Entrophospora sp. SA101]
MKREEACKVLQEPLQKLIYSSSSSHTINNNKFIVHSIIFEIWQLYLNPEGAYQHRELNLDVIFQLNSELYTKLIELLELDQELIRTLYMIPLSSNPMYGIKHVIIPSLNVSNSLNGDKKHDLIDFIQNLLSYHYNDIIDEETQLDLFLMNNLVSTPFYYNDFRKNSINNYTTLHKINYENSKTLEIRKKINYHLNTIEDLQLDANRKKQNNYKTLNLLINFIDEIAFPFKEDYDEYQSTQLRLAKSFITQNVILKKNDSLKEFLEYIDQYDLEKYNISTRSQKSYSKEISTRLAKCLHNDKELYKKMKKAKQKKFNNLDISNSNNLDGGDVVDLKTHELAFVNICYSLYENFEYDGSFVNWLEDSELSYKMNSSLFKKKDLEICCKWVMESVKVGRPGWLSLFKLMIQYIDLFPRPSSMNIKSPTFGSEKFWPFSLDDQLTIICNQLIATSKSKEIIDKADNIQAKMVDSLIITSVVSPYYTLHRLIGEVIHNKGQGIVILDIINQLGSLCWYNQASRSPAIIIQVLKDILSTIDESEDGLTHQEQKNLIDFIIQATMNKKNLKKPAIELKIGEIGEWSSINSKSKDDVIVIIDLLEYIRYCVLPYLQFSNPILSSQISESWWLIRAEPLLLLNHLIRLFDQRKLLLSSSPSISITLVDDIHFLLKELLRLLTEYFISLPQDYDQNEYHRSNVNSIKELYKDSKDYNWATQLYLYQFFEICSSCFGFDISKPAIPSLLFSFCNFSDKEYTESPSDEDNVKKSGVTLSNQVKKMKQLILFLEACQVSSYWCEKFVLALNNNQNASKPYLRNLFRKVAPLAFCYVLANSVEEEAYVLLDTMIRKLIVYGIISASELLIDENNNNKELFEMAISEIDIE